MILKIDIPMLPVSVNAQYNKGGMGVWLTSDARIYRKAVEVLAQQAVRTQGWKYAEKGKYIKMVAIYTMPKGCQKDIGNDKITADALEGIVYQNDNQIVDLRLIKIFGTNFQQTKILIELTKKTNLCETHL